MPEQTATQTGGPAPEPTSNQVPRLVITWLVVTVPLAYGLFQTVRSVIPLFTS
ncbi:MFS transporter small subunit [Promicromonospora sp. NFX87]|uniref:MFS transporter small subunit n=1 Tax=Promicromonospora sp. NFX87 TaxID=3402691 RepID=UPI003AFA8319